jgi:hypothetical protein
MSYETIVAGYAEVFAAVDGLSAAQVLDYEPSSINPGPGEPVMYFLLESFQRSAKGQVRRMDYTTTGRLCFLWQDNEAAEVELRPFVNALPAALDADPFLGGRLAGDGAGYLGGYAECSGAVVVYVEIDGVKYKAIDYTLPAFEKFQNRLAGL